MTRVLRDRIESNGPLLAGSEAVENSSSDLDLDELEAEAQFAITREEFVEACILYTRILEHDQTRFAVFANRGYSRYRLGDFWGCLDDCDKGLLLVPNSLVVLNTKSLALMELRNFDEAKESLEQILALEPKNAIAIANFAELLRKLAAEKNDLAYELFNESKKPPKEPQITNPGGPPDSFKRFFNLGNLNRDFFPIEDSGDTSGGGRARETARAERAERVAREHVAWAAEEAAKGAAIGAATGAAGGAVVLGGPGVALGAAGGAAAGAVGAVATGCVSCHRPPPRIGGRHGGEY